MHLYNNNNTNIMIQYRTHTQKIEFRTAHELHVLFIIHINDHNYIIGMYKCIDDFFFKTKFP